LQSNIIALDETTMLFCRMLKETIAAEPPLPDAENHAEPDFREASDKHYAWYRQLEATHLMLQARLRTIIEDQVL
jgi:hypothetical protein